MSQVTFFLLVLNIVGQCTPVPTIYFFNDSVSNPNVQLTDKTSVHDVSANLDFESNEVMIVEGNSKNSTNDSEVPILRRQRMTSEANCPNDDNAITTGGLDVRIAQLIETASSLTKGSMKIMYPGTLWCGPGHTAPDEKTLGKNKYTDVCCRQHDNCPMSMAPGDVLHDLKNNGIFTRSHCDCDEKFHACLVNSTRTTSDQIGAIYFNMLEPQCFKEEHPIQKCEKRSKNKCITYLKDMKKPKKWQWMDTKYYP